MKVLHILDVSIPDLKGYSIRAKGIVTGQKKIGIDPVVLTSFRQNKYNAAQEDINGIKYYRSGEFNTILSLPSFAMQAIEIKQLSALIRQVAIAENIDILHAHSPILCGYAAYLAGKKLNLPVVYEIRAFWEDAAVSSGKCTDTSLRYKVTRSMETFLCKKVNQVIAICNGIKDDLVYRGISEEKIDLVPNGISIDAFKALPKSQELIKKYNLENQTVLGFIGSFFKFEGVDLLVSLMKELKNEPIKLLLVGEGEEFSSIVEKTKSLGLENKIIIVGRIPHEEISGYYSIVDIFIYPRISERITELTTPLKPLEAMAMSKNVIISSVGGLREIVPENCGKIFVAGDVLDLKEKVQNFVYDEKIRKQYAENAYQFALSRNWDEVVKSYVDIYNRLSI